MKNNFLAFLLAAIACLPVTRLYAETYSGYCSNYSKDLTWKLDTETGVLTIAGTGGMPSYYYSNSYYYNEPSPWNEYRTYIQSVRIESGVTSIGSYAFYECSNLTSVTIANSVEIINECAFYECSSLMSLTIPNSVTDIRYYAFYGVFNVAYNGKAEGSPWGAEYMNCYIDGNLFYYDDKKTLLLRCHPSATGTITIPNSVTYIEEYAFKNCSGLTSISIGNGVTNIGEYTFKNCSGLTSITIGNGVESIGESAFTGCSALTSVVWNVKSFTNPSSASSAPFYSLRSQITSFTFGKEVETIPAYLCYEMAKLTTITIPNSVTTIGAYAFSNCTGLTTITIPENVQSLGSLPFDQCTGLTSVIWNAVKCETYAEGYAPFRNCPYITSFTIGKKVEEIPYGLCSNLPITTIEIPKSLKSIGSYAFLNCTSLTSITIPNNVTTIGMYAFYGCTALTNLTIPKGVTDIGDDAFYYVCNVIYNGTATGSPWGARFMNCYAEDFLVYSDDTKKELIACSSSDVTTITIPNTVKIIGNSVFSGCTALTSVTMPASVDTVRNDAFANCTALKAVYVSDLAAWCGIWFGNINSNPLYNAHHLYVNEKEVKKLAIPESVTTIGWGAFCGCTALTSVTIPNGVTNIEGVAFKDCTGLKSVTIPESVQNTGALPFDNCTGLTSVTWKAIKDTTYDDGQYVYPPFQNCPNITSFTIGKKVEELPNALCYGLPIETIDIPSSVTSIGVVAFKSCESLTSVTIPKNVKTIGSGAFAECTGLTTVVWNAKDCEDPEYYQYAPFYYISEQITSFTFGEDVETIPSYLCYGMSKLTSVTIGKNVTAIGSYVFNYCSGLTSIVWNAKNCNLKTDSDEDYIAYYDYSPFYSVNSQITSFTFGEDVETIPTYLCYYMSNLTSVTIGKKVTSIGEGAFYNCSGLTAVHISDLAAWCKISFGNKEANPLYAAHHLFVNGNEVTDLVIPDKVTAISHYAFCGCTSLTSVTIPNSVKTIDSYVFEGCKNINNAVIGEGITSIGGGAFSGCEALSSITIPVNVDTIGYAVFNGCTDITAINWNAKNVKYDQAPFVYSISSQITSFTFGEKVEVIPHSLCSGMSNLTSVTIPGSVTSIGDYAFGYCSGLTSVTIPNGLTSINNGVFSGCTGLTSITIPDGVETIGDNAFYNCSGMTSVTIPGSVTSIGDGAFYGCEGLKGVYISDLAAWCGIDFVDFYGYYQSNPLYYAEHLYVDNEEVTSLVIPDGVTNISKKAFENAKSLTTVTLPSSVSTIGAYAFAGCSGVKRFYCYATTPPAVSESAIENYNAYLYVPCSSMEDYDLDNVWGNFKHIECIPDEATAINTTSSDMKAKQVRKTIRNGALYIEYNGKTYNAQGAEL